MEDSDEFKWAVKVVIKRQMRDLMEQLRERGEEIAILTVNLDDNSCSHFGSPNGEWFVSEQKNLAQNFLKFCKVKDKRGVRNADSTPSPHTGFDSFSTPRSSTFKQRTAQSAGAPTLTVTVPKQLAGDITEEELAALVGRIVASQLAIQEKGDGSSGGTKFDLLVEAANQSKKKEGMSSVLSTPSTRSTRKRKVTQKYREGMSTLKKGKKSEEEDTGSEYETVQDENAIINILAELSTPILKRVKVKTSEEVPISIEKSVLMSSENLESLAVLLIQELDEMAGGLLTKEKLIQVQLVLDEDNEEEKIIVELDSVQTIQKKTEEMDDSDMEYLDLAEENEYRDKNFGEDEDQSAGQSDQDGSDYDPDFDPGASFEIKETNSTLGGTGDSRKRGRPRSGNPRRKKKPLSECTPVQCDQCDTVLTGISSLKAHVKRMHLKQNDFLCHICSKAFFTTTHREDHIISVHTRKCEVCSRDVVESEPWEEGISKKNLRIAKCPCGNDVHYISKVGRAKTIVDDEFKDRPKKRKSLAETTPMTCEDCGQILVGKSSLLAHIKRQHLKAFDHKCTICSKEFFTSTHLKTHVLSLHTRKCKNCNAFVMEEEPWSENMDRANERIVTCKCGTPVTIFTKLGPKHRIGNGETPARKRQKKSSSDTRYVCGTCGKIFLKKTNAMSHTCITQDTDNSIPKTVQCTSCEQSFTDESEMKEHYKQIHESKFVDEGENMEFKVEGDDYVLEEGSQVVMYEPSDDRSASAIASIQIMHDGKLVPAEQVIDEHGNVSFVLKNVQ